MSGRNHIHLRPGGQTSTRATEVSSFLHQLRRLGGERTKRTEQRGRRSGPGTANATGNRARNDPLPPGLRAQWGVLCKLCPICVSHGSGGPDKVGGDHIMFTMHWECDFTEVSEIRSWSVRCPFIVLSG